VKLYQFNLPTRDNSGARLGMAHRNWSRLALELAGGLTEHKGQGAWLDGGKVYHDALIVYTVATADITVFDRLVSEAFKCFPDQLAIYAAVIGTAAVYERSV
jgi:hypothetical protein